MHERVFWGHGLPKCDFNIILFYLLLCCICCLYSRLFRNEKFPWRARRASHFSAVSKRMLGPFKETGEENDSFIDQIKYFSIIPLTNSTKLILTGLLSCRFLLKALKFRISKKPILYKIILFIKLIY